MTDVSFSLSVGAELNVPPAGDADSSEIPKIPWRSCVNVSIRANPPRRIDQIQPIICADAGMILRDGLVRQVEASNEEKQLEFNIIPTKLGTISFDFHVARDAAGPTVIQSYPVDVVSPFAVPGWDPYGVISGLPMLKYERTGLSQQIFDAIANASGQRILVVHGPTCTGKTTVIGEAMAQIKAAGVATVVEVAPADIMQVASVGELWKRLDAAFHAACAPEPTVALSQQHDYWWKKLDSAVKYESRRHRLLYDYLNIKKPKPAFMVIMLDELDRIAGRPSAVKTTDLLSILIDEILLGVLDDLKIHGVLVFADLEADLRKRWAEFPVEHDTILLPPMSIPLFSLKDVHLYMDDLFGDLVPDSYWKGKIASKISKITGGIPPYVNRLLDWTLQMWLEDGLPPHPTEDHYLTELGWRASTPDQAINGITDYMTNEVSTWYLDGPFRTAIKNVRMSLREQVVLKAIAAEKSKKIWMDHPPAAVPALVARGLIESNSNSAWLRSPLLREYLLHKTP
jgi:hypothetical protein